MWDSALLGSTRCEISVSRNDMGFRSSFCGLNFMDDSGALFQIYLPPTQPAQAIRSFNPHIKLTARSQRKRCYVTSIIVTLFLGCP